MDAAPWHVLHVQARHERSIARYLSVHTAEFYLPLYSERVKWTDRYVVTERPLFPGYIFLRYAPDQRISILSIPGVFRIMGDEPRDLVSNLELMGIREGLAQSLHLRPYSGVVVGTRVRVRSGALEGVNGVVRELRHNCEVILSLAATHQQFLLKTTLDNIAVLS